ncbi:MAG TPA: hypothetical protein VNK04_25375, partial [Gemmataceae bacterium]|nr:hypothetical protein [Gemmataceae bacterium]
MKRRPQRLQVSTFPFLAVLLCAMGSLILVLLVMDRRAKLVARAKAMQAVVAEERRQEARRAEWERRRQELHARLAQQDDEVRRQMQAILGRIEAALAETRSEEERARKLQEQVEAERTALARLEQELAAARAGQTAGGSDPVHAEMARLSAEVDQLERTVAAIKAARQQARQTFSVVPYHGRRGDSRRPIYIECAAAGVIFHPDRLTLPPTEFSRLEIRAEVARRLASLLPSQTPGPSDKEGAYLLLLVRPSGIISYYLTLEALKGLPLAFGYELIEDDWVLDFPRDHDPVNQPWMATARAASLPTAREPGAGTRLNPPRGVAFGAGSAAEGEGALPRRSGAGGDSLSPVGLLEPGQGLGGAALANPYGRPRSSTPATGLVSDQRGVVPSVDRSPPHPQPLSPTGGEGRRVVPFSPTGGEGRRVDPLSSAGGEGRTTAPFSPLKGASASLLSSEAGASAPPLAPVGEKGKEASPLAPVGE